MDRIELELYLNNLLETSRFKDYCPNGLQVEGRRKVEKIATGVTASTTRVQASTANAAQKMRARSAVTAAPPSRRRSR